MKTGLMRILFALFTLSAVILATPLRASGSGAAESAGNGVSAQALPADIEDALRKLEGLNRSCRSSMAALRGSLVAIAEQLDAAVENLEARASRGESTDDALEDAAENVLAFVRDIVRRAQGDVESLLGASEANARPLFEQLDRWFREHSTESWLSEQSMSRTAERIKEAMAGYSGNKSQLEALKHELDENANALRLPPRPMSPIDRGI